MRRAPAVARANRAVAGDTLSGIAQRFGVTLAALEAANPQITNPALIFPGEVIEVPGVAPPGGQDYTVVAGDTMSSIAAKFGVTLAALEAANPQITNPNLIFPGEIVHIPGAGKTYTVVAGDTMTSIAAKFGISLACLEQANPQVTDPNLIHPGDVLNIPTATTTTYTVQPGDFMYSIAVKFGISLAALEAANPQVTNPSQIFPGQVLNIPGQGC